MRREKDHWIATVEDFKGLEKDYREANLDKPIMPIEVWRESFPCESKAEIPRVPTWRELGKVDWTFLVTDERDGS